MKPLTQAIERAMHAKVVKELEALEAKVLVYAISFNRQADLAEQAGKTELAAADRELAKLYRELASAYGTHAARLDVDSRFNYPARLKRSKARQSVQKAAKKATKR